MSVVQSYERASAASRPSFGVVRDARGSLTMRTHPLVRMAVLVVAAGLAACIGPGSQGSRSAHKVATTARERAVAGTPRSTRSTVRAPVMMLPASPPSARQRLRYVATIGGHISPKSVDASGAGLVFAQNMIYTHTVTVYDDRNYHLVATIPDAVTLRNWGYPQYPGRYLGGPVEAAFSPDRRYVYVSNYSMYGPALTHQGHDVCSPADDYDSSFVYRIRVSTMRIDQVIHVGSVPKFLAVTHDDKYLLVSDWCSYALSVVSVPTAKEIRRIPLGPYPRGIAVDPSSDTAYVAIMGGAGIAKINLHRFTVGWIRDVGTGPRHLVMSPTGRWLYATLNADGTVAKIDPRTGQVVARVPTGRQPRSMAIAPDGQSLYVVNYGSNTVTKVRTSDMTVIQTVQTNSSPIGITYVPDRRQIWVACYTGTIMVFEDA
jgi:YVTN family beta-propeller protein